jgi:deoxyadenosine/deoxycytidine kinase
MNTFISEDDIGINLSSWNSGEINTLFITGISGSGKTTLAKKYAKDFKCTKVHLDTFWHMGFLPLNKIKDWSPLIYQYINEGRVDKNWLKPYLAKKKKSYISIQDYKDIRNTVYKLRFS